jgi:predicted nucleic acid-binding protein
MPFVLDASVALAWCFVDETTSKTEAILERLADDSAIVPTLWEFEVANALLVAERRRRLSESQSARFIELLTRLPIHVDVTSSDMAGVLAIGRRHGLSAYDSSYLVLAERDGVPLATGDEKLRSAASRAGVPLM